MFDLNPRVLSACSPYTYSHYYSYLLNVLSEHFDLNDTFMCPQEVTSRESFQNTLIQNDAFLVPKYTAKTKPSPCHQVAYIVKGHSFISKNKEGDGIGGINGPTCK